MGAFNQGVQAHSVEKRRDLNIKNLVKLLNNVYVNTYYFDFSRKLLSGSSDIRVPEDQNDIQTKIAEIAMRNMIEYIKSNGKINHYFTNELYMDALKDIADESNYPICNFDIFNENCEVKNGKHINIRQIKYSLKK